MMMGRLSRTEELKPNIKYDLIVSTCNTSLLAEIQDQPTECLSARPTESSFIE
jgi:hypothetical protein